MDSMQDFDRARSEVISLFAVPARDWGLEKAAAMTLVTTLVDDLIYDRPDLVVRLSERARRAWYWPRGQIDPKVCPLVWFGGDEYLNRTVALRIPFAGALIVALNIPLRRIPVPSSVEDPHEWLRESRPASVLERNRVRDMAVGVVRAVRARAR